jgi:hypothetical protein
LEGDLTVEGMGVEGLTAFAFLPLRSDVDEAMGILSRTLAVASRPDPDGHQVEVVASAMVRLGEQVLGEADAPDWLVESAYESGLSLRQVVSMWVRLRLLDAGEFPETIDGWADVMVSVLAEMPYGILSEMLYLKAFEGSKIRALADPEASDDHAAAWAVFRNFLHGWLSGTSLTDLAAVAVKDDAAGKSGRGSGNPLPKIIGLTEQILIFGMTRVAGALSVLVQTAVLSEPGLGWGLSSRGARSLEQLSIGIRAGCGDEASLAWWRMGGVRHRRLSHLVARLMPVPEDVITSDEAVSNWMRAKRPELLDPEFFLDARHALDEGERAALTALALSEE